jgi:hypothetical protein
MSRDMEKTIFRDIFFTSPVDTFDSPPLLPALIEGGTYIYHDFPKPITHSQPRQVHQHVNFLSIR